MVPRPPKRARRSANKAKRSEARMAIIEKLFAELEARGRGVHGRHEYYIMQGREVIPCTMRQWASWLHQTRESKCIGRTRIDGDLMVSTVFLGLDHNWGSGPPLLFETMVFGGPKDQEIQYRYSAYDEAELGHRETVTAMVAAQQRAGMPGNTKEERMPTERDA